MGVGGIQFFNKICFLAVILNVCAVRATVSYGSNEFNEKCSSDTNCRAYAYKCVNNTCQCAPNYRPENTICVGAIEQHCMYDNHCVEGAFCRNQTLCECKEVKPIPSDDLWGCSGAAAVIMNGFILLSVAVLSRAIIAI